MAIELNGAPEGVVGPIRNALGGAAKAQPTTFSASQTFTKGLFLAGANLTDAATIQWDLATSGFAAVEINGNRALELLNLSPGVHRLRVTQGEGGGHGITSFTGVVARAPGGVLAFSPAAGAVDWLTIICFSSTTIDVLIESDFQEI
jgi:hypothetical protein